MSMSNLFWPLKKVAPADKLVVPVVFVSVPSKNPELWMAAPPPVKNALASSSI
uniref:Uncharacterized protein n=1 Tax=Arundo donax TaxID=35708 RepID=A0A0A8Z0I3_ARUDO